MKYNEALQDITIRRKIILTSLGYKNVNELANDLQNHGGTGRRAAVNNWLNNAETDKKAFEKNYQALVECLSDRPFTVSANPLETVLSVLKECGLAKAELDDYTKLAEARDALSFWQKLLKQMFLGYAFPIEIESDDIRITNLATEEYGGLAKIVKQFLYDNRGNPSTEPLAKSLSEYCLGRLDNMSENMAHLVYELTDYYDKLKDENGENHEADKEYARAILDKFISLREERLCELPLDRLRLIVGCCYSIMLDKTDTVLRRGEANLKEAKTGFDLAASYYPLALSYDKISELDDTETLKLAALYYSDVGAYYLNVYKIEKKKGASPELLQTALNLAKINHERSLRIREKLVEKDPVFKSNEAQSRFNLATDYFYMADLLLLPAESEKRSCKIDINGNPIKTAPVGLWLEKDLRTDKSLEALADDWVETEPAHVRAARYLDYAIDEHIECYKFRVSLNADEKNQGPVDASRNRIINTMTYKKEKLPDKIELKDCKKIAEVIQKTEHDPYLPESKINSLLNSLNFICERKAKMQK